MKIIFKIIPILLFALSMQSCTKEKQSTDTGQTSDSELIGNWKIVSTSVGFSGGGYTPNFDFLRIDSTLKFEVLDSNDVIAKGFIEELDAEPDEYLINLVAEEIFISDYIYIIEEIEHYVSFEEDIMRFTAPCCDRLNSSFERED